MLYSDVESNSVLLVADDETFLRKEARRKFSLGPFI